MSAGLNMITILTGDSSFEIKRYLEKIRSDFDGEPENISGEDLLVADLPDILMNTSLFSLKRLVIIRGLSENKIIWPVFSDWIDRISDDIQLVLVEQKIDKRTSTFKAVKQKAEIIEFQAFNDRDIYKLEKWLDDESKAMNLDLDKKCRQALIEIVGNDQWQLYSSLEKLLLSNEKPSIDLLQKTIPQNPHASAFDLFESSLNGDVSRLKQLIDSLKQIEDAYKIFALISSQATQLNVICYANGDDDVARDFDMHPFVVQKTKQLSKKISKFRSTQIIDILLKTDYQMKTTQLDPWLLVEKTLYQIMNLN